MWPNPYLEIRVESPCFDRCEHGPISRKGRGHGVMVYSYVTAVSAVDVYPITKRVTLMVKGPLCKVLKKVIIDRSGMIC